MDAGRTRKGIFMADNDLISFHRKLLNAPERMQLYQMAIMDTVRPGDVVLDVGCGSGILGLFACQAGARRVYAIERSDAISVARELAAANGFADRIVYLNEDIKDVHLDEPADVIVSELISKGVIGQKMAEVIGYCRDHLLRTGGRILPYQVDLFVAPMEDNILYRKIQLPEKSVYGLDFTPFALRSCNNPLSAHIPVEALLSAGQVAYHYDAPTAANSDRFDAKLVFEVEKAGALQGFCAWFSSVLADGVVLSNKPPGIAAWDNLFLPLAQPVHVEPGMTVELSLKGRDDSQMPFIWIWDTTVRNNGQILTEQRQSTFFAKIPPVSDKSQKVSNPE
jgi:SAM-dependent methyltransferase